MTSQPDWWAHELARLFDLSLERSAALLLLFDDPSCWMVGPVEGTAVIRVPPGAEQKGALAVLLRAPPGRRIPEHTHWTEETVLMFRGTVQEDCGRKALAGEKLVS